MKSRAASRRGDSGFTLVELLIVIGATAAVMLFTVPVAIRFYQGQLVDDTARLLKDTLRRAHDASIARRNDRAHGVKIITASSTFVHFEGSSYATRVPSADELITYPDSISISASTTEVTFSELYGTSTISETWTLSMFAGASSGLSINSQGLVELQ